MSGSSFGKIFRLTTFGESHGAAIGGIIDGCPAGVRLDEAIIQRELDLRKPGSGPASTKRKEPDRIELLSGVLSGVTTGTPIGFIIQNTNQRSGDYDRLAGIFRPSHADWGYHCKYGGIRDHRGGGRSSGRETASRVAGGAIAAALLKQAFDYQIAAACVEFAGIAVPEAEIDIFGAPVRPYFAASDTAPQAWDKAVEEARRDQDSLGGIVRIVARNVPAGLGEPVFDKLDAMLAFALMSVGAVKGVEFGAGFRAAAMRGSAHNDSLLQLVPSPVSCSPLATFGSNNAGGIAGGISTGQDIVINVAVKPIASIGKPQRTIDRNGAPVTIEIGGRHDLSAIPRIVPVLTAMANLALADSWLLQKRQLP